MLPRVCCDAWQLVVSATVTLRWVGIPDEDHAASDSDSRALPRTRQVTPDSERSVSPEGGRLSNSMSSFSFIVFLNVVPGEVALEAPEASTGSETKHSLGSRRPYYYYSYYRNYRENVKTIIIIIMSIEGQKTTLPGASA
jgi:hypothetical protein